MKKRSTVLSVIVLALCVVLLVALVPVFNRPTPNFASQPLQSPIETRPVPATPEPNGQATQGDLNATYVVQATATTAALMTAMPTLVPTLTPLPSGQRCYVDPVNNFTLLLNPGWQANPPPTGAANGDTILYNYNVEAVGGSEVGGGGDLPQDAMKIQMAVGELNTNQTFEQWLSDRINVYGTSAAPTPLTTTVPSPYTLGRYSGVSFLISGYGPNALEIALPINGSVAVIGLIPADSPTLPEAVSMLSTLNVSDVETCVLTPVAVP